MWGARKQLDQVEDTEHGQQQLLSHSSFGPCGSDPPSFSPTSRGSLPIRRFQFFDGCVLALSTNFETPPPNPAPFLATAVCCEANNALSGLSQQGSGLL
eukprot:m.471344 g.471344  ORF g.471344 m.471344 type:complete len:99 (-) comp30884_c0_seq1:44-340(-)